VPTIVYGYFALTFVTPLLQGIFTQLTIFNVLSAGLVMGVMIIPTIASVSEDAIYAVPRSLAGGSLRPWGDQARDGD
jgi:ABC-type phosphate transport system, permease component